MNQPNPPAARWSRLALPLVGVLIGVVAGWLGWDVTHRAVRGATGSVVEAGRIGVDQLLIGDCIDRPAGKSFSGLVARPCGEPHDAEVYAVVARPTAIDAGDSNEGWAARNCLDRLNRFAELRNRADLAFSYFSPADDGAGWVQCLAVRLDSGKLIGPLTESPRI